MAHIEFQPSKPQVDVSNTVTCRVTAVLSADFNIIVLAYHLAVTDANGICGVPPLAATSTASVTVFNHKKAAASTGIVTA